MSSDEPATATRFNFPSLGNSPELLNAFLVLSGKHPHPRHTDRASYLRRCQAVLEDAIDRVEIQRRGKAVFWPYHRPGDTNTHRQNREVDSHTQAPDQDPGKPSTLQWVALIDRA